MWMETGPGNPKVLGEKTLKQVEIIQFCLNQTTKL